MRSLAMAVAAIAAPSWGCGRSGLDEPVLAPVDAAAPVDRAQDLLQDRAGPDAPDGAARMDAPMLGPLCLSAALSDPTLAVLAETSAGELYLYRADGSRIDVGPSGRLIWRAGEFLVAVGHAGAQLQITLVDRQGTVLWSYATAPDEQIEPGEVWVNDQGAATVLLSANSSRRWGVAIAPDGTPTDLAKEPLGAPDSEGWVPVATAPGTCPCGFVKPGSAELLPATLPLARPSYGPSVASDRDRLFYLGLDAGVPTLVMTEPGGVQTFPMPFVDPTATTVTSLDEGALVLERALPRALLLPNPWGIVEVGPLPSEAPLDTLVWTRGAFGLVAVRNVPRWRLNLRTADIWPIAPLPQNVYQVTGTWALGGRYWRLDFSTGDVLSDDLKDLAPLIPFGSGCKSSALELLDDGRVALALVESGEVGLYVGQLGQAPWTRIGWPVVGVISLDALRFGGTWLLAADSGKNTFCPPTATPPPDAGGAPLQGDSVQIVTPGAPEPVVFPGYRSTEFVFQEAGLCAVERSTAHDFATGVQTALPPVDQDAYYGAQVFWW